MLIVVDFGFKASFLFENKREKLKDVMLTYENIRNFSRRVSAKSCGKIFWPLIFSLISLYTD